MKPTNREQLARFLDQIRSAYPGSIPVEALAVEPTAADVASSPRYHMIVVRTSAETPPEERALLDAIASKGLKIESSSYSVSEVSQGEAHEVADSSESECVIVFGAEAPIGWRERSSGRPILFASPLASLVTEPSAKRELWGHLQKGPVGR